MVNADNDTRIDISGAPAVPGLWFHAHRGEPDFAPLVTVANESAGADGIEYRMNVEQARQNYEHLVNCDPQRDIVLAQVDDVAVAYAATDWRVDDEGTALHRSYMFVRPAWRRQGIEDALLHYLADRIREIAAGHPAGRPRLMTAVAFEGETWWNELLLREGYAPVRYFFDMVRPALDDLPEVLLPDGIELRPVQPEHFRAIWNAAVEAFRDHWGNVTPGETDYDHWLHQPNHDTSLWRVAWDGDQVAGVTLNVINAEENAQAGKLEGWVDDLAVRRPWRRRGLGRALLVASLHAFKERGMTSAGLGVDAENLSGALRLYERLGFTTVRRSTGYRKPLTA